MRRDRAGAALAAGFGDAYLADDAWMLARLLGPSVCVVVDAGGRCEPGEPGAGEVVGIAAALTLLRRTLGDPASLRFQVRAVNGRPGLVVSRGGAVASVAAVVAVVILSGRHGAVDHVWVVADPQKLGRWS